MIEKQLRAIRKVATKNLHKNPEYFQMLIDEIDIKLAEIEIEELTNLEDLC